MRMVAKSAAVKEEKRAPDRRGPSRGCCVLPEVRSVGAMANGRTFMQGIDVHQGDYWITIPSGELVARISSTVREPFPMVA